MSGSTPLYLFFFLHITCIHPFVYKTLKETLMIPVRIHELGQVCVEI